MGAKRAYNRQGGFTLIELSIVLVIIGLIVGGILVGQNLVAAAGIRATVTQVEKFNTATNTFFGKYGYLPGDIPDPAASSFGFAARGLYAGEGDGNGILMSNYGSATPSTHGQCSGEVQMFWVDLSAAHLIDGSFTNGKPSTQSPSLTWTSISGLGVYFPTAKIGGNNMFFVANNTGSVVTGLGANNYFGLVQGIDVGITIGCDLNSQAGLTVAQASAIDTKMDDGLPQSGNVEAAGISTYTWAAGAGGGYYLGQAGAGSAASCYDNGNNAANTSHYSVEINNGTNVNCALVFKMQAGD